MSERATVAEGLRVLGDPIRWSILRQVAEGDELACSRLEETLPVSKPTISYHTKVLVQAGLIDVRRRGRRSFYALREEALQAITGELRTLTLAGETAGRLPTPSAERVQGGLVEGRGAVTEAALITW